MSMIKKEREFNAYGIYFFVIYEEALYR